MSGVDRLLGEPELDGRLANLPRPAVNMASRVAQLARQRRGQLVEVRVLIMEGQWFLLVDGHTERLGKG